MQSDKYHTPSCKTASSETNEAKVEVEGEWRVLVHFT